MRCSGLPPLANLTDLPPNPEIDVRCRILNMGGAALSNCMVISHTWGGGVYYSVKQTAAYLGVGNPIAIVDENTHHIIWFIWYTEDAADACAKGNPRCALMWCAQNKAHWTQIFHWNNTTHIANVAGGRDHTCGWLMQCMVNICASDRPGSDISAAALSCICTQPLVLVHWSIGALVH